MATLQISEKIQFPRKFKAGIDLFLIDEMSRDPVTKASGLALDTASSRRLSSIGIVKSLSQMNTWVN